ncbi:MAG: hypothetical protein MZW92_81510 [Comamonadaceae bacterium]|nr:hypothetical protein [Comamonadaceae bacterium]
MERGYVPDWLTRTGIRRLAGRTAARRGRAATTQARDAALEQLIAELRASPIALHTTAANEQHYEVPAGVLPAGAGAAPQVHVRAGGRPSVRDLDDGRGGHARR